MIVKLHGGIPKTGNYQGHHTGGRGSQIITPKATLLCEVIWHSM